MQTRDYKIFYSRENLHKFNIKGGIEYDRGSRQKIEDLK